MAKKDLKEGLNSSRKPDITHIRGPFMNYGARPSEYGDEKYHRANYLVPTKNPREDYKRFRKLLRAALSHLVLTLDSMEDHQGRDQDLEDIAGMKEACYAVDLDAKPGCPIGPSKLPHICGTVASLNIAITQAVQAGLLPADPGTPWKDDAATPGVVASWDGEPTNHDFSYPATKSSAQLLQESIAQAKVMKVTSVTIEKDRRGVPVVTINEEPVEKEPPFGYTGRCTGRGWCGSNGMCDYCLTHWLPGRSK